jgi:hypothetical protein
MNNLHTAHAAKPSQTTHETLTHWKKLTDPRFIGVYALPNDAEDLTVTIDFVKYEELTMMGGKKEWHTVVYLADQKPLIINKTNASTIEKLYSPYIENWPGKKITLFASTCNFGREKNVPCLRIRPSLPSQKQFIADERLKTALKKIDAGQYTLEKLRATFEITQEQEAIISQPRETDHV